jgi:hypothetical protein
MPMRLLKARMMYKKVRLSLVNCKLYLKCDAPNSMSVIDNSTGVIYYCSMFEESSFTIVIMLIVQISALTFTRVINL